jgi:hypothetical protein
MPRRKILSLLSRSAVASSITLIFVAKDTYCDPGPFALT